jgi:hypothetical protein
MHAFCKYTRMRVTRKLNRFEKVLENFFIEELIEAEVARLLENENQFSSCDVLRPERSLSCWTGGQGRHLRVKRPNVAHRHAPRKASRCSGN